MVANLTVGKKGYEEFSDELKVLKEKLIPLRERFILLIDQDAESFRKVMAAFAPVRLLPSRNGWFLAIPKA